MKKICIVLSLLISGLFSSEIQAQMTLYYMDRLPQIQQYNPALVPKVKFFLELPVIGNNQVELNNSGFNLGQFLDFSDNLNKANYNPDEFVNSLGDYNKTTGELRKNLLNFGFSLKKNGYFSMGFSVRNGFDITAPSDVVYLLVDNEKIADKMPLAINETNVRMNVFSQLSFTYARTIGTKLSVGITPKLIGALGGIYSEKINTEIRQTAPGEFDAKFDGKVQIGLPVPINPAAIGNNGELDTNEDLLDPDWAKNLSAGSAFQNSTLAVDLGANYQLNESWSFSASLLDIGGSNWKKYAYDISYNGETATVKDLSKLKMKIPSKILVGADYKLSGDWNAGFLFRNVGYESGNFSAATLSLNGYVGRMLSTSVSYTAGHRFDNLGFGLRLRFFPGTDFYLVTDNVLQAFNYKSIQYSRLSFGINLAFGVGSRSLREVEISEEL